MKSRTSCCNGTILKKQLLRGLPLWGIYLAAWIMALPMHLLSRSQWPRPMEAKIYVLELASVNTHIIPALYAVAAACLLFSHLYNSRSANFFGALPLRRETMFTTNYLAGLLFFAVPAVLTTALTVAAGLAVGVNVAKEALIFLGCSAMAYVFFFSFAVLCAMAVGHLVALPLLFAVLNFTTVVVEAIVREIVSTFVYGLYFQSPLVSAPFSPLYQLLAEEPVRVRSVFETVHNVTTVTGYEFYNWGLLPVYCAVGVVFAAAAFLMYRHRHMETAGDVISGKVLKPVFLYCFSVGCALVACITLCTIVIPGYNSTNFLPVTLFLLAGAVVGYFLGQMMLHKTLRVFRKQHWLNCSVVCAVLVALMLCCRFDAFGYGRYVPEADEVQTVTIGSGSACSEDPAQIDRVLRLHHSLVDRQRETEQMLRGGTTYSPSVTIRYKLTNGREISRRYAIPVTKETAADPDSLICQYEAAYNDPDYVILRHLPDHYTTEDIVRASISMETGNRQFYLTPTESYTLLKHGIEADIRDGNLGTNYWTDNLRFQTDDGALIAESVKVEEAEDWIGCHLEFEFDQNMEDDRFCYFTVRTTYTHTIAALRQLGYEIG